MLNNPETISSIYHPIEQCPQCGYFKRTQEQYCTACGDRLPVTTPVPPQAGVLPLNVLERDGHVQFAPDCVALLQTLNRAVTVELPLALTAPVVLGRKVLPVPDDLLDLSVFNAFQHGVSRRHCQFERQGDRLLVTDLGSSNGTYLNGEALLPYTQYAVADGDFLVVGTLQFRVLFVCSGEST